MTALFQNPDGANYQARAVLAYLSARDGIESSWDDEFKRYRAEPSVDRWHNCREQGYVVSLRAANGKQLNLAFFEHRNSDQIHALEWEQHSVHGNPIHIDNADFGGKVYKDKYDTSHRVDHGRCSEMADWIFGRLTDFWTANAGAAPRPGVRSA